MSKITATTILVAANTIRELPPVSPRWAIARAARAVESGSAIRAYICRNTRGPKGRISSGKVVRYAAGMTTDRHLLAAPHYDQLFIAP